MLLGFWGVSFSLYVYIVALYLHYGGTIFSNVRLFVGGLSEILHKNGFPRNLDDGWDSAEFLLTFFNTVTYEKHLAYLGEWYLWISTKVDCYASTIWGRQNPVD